MFAVFLVMIIDQVGGIGHFFFRKAFLKPFALATGVRESQFFFSHCSRSTFVFYVKAHKDERFPKKKWRRKKILMHNSLYAGKRRCLTPRMPLEQHLELHAAHQECRTAQDFGTRYIPDDETIYIGTYFHFVTPNKSRTKADMIQIMQNILQVMNGCFGNTYSPLVNFNRVERGPFVTSSTHHQKLYESYKARACSANMRFLLAAEPSLDYINHSDLKHVGSDPEDMEMCDRLLKEEVSPAVDPRHLYNIWVVTDVKSVLLGYGNFPKVNPSARDLALDGFVYFTSPAPYHLHVTAVHESGHVWSVNHPFYHDMEKNEYDDNIDDTPFQRQPDYGAIWDKAAPWPHSDQDGKKHYHGIPNYMNYVNDDCMFMFTKGQVRKIRDTANSVRRGWNLTAEQVRLLESGSPYPITENNARIKEVKEIKLKQDPFPYRRRFGSSKKTKSPKLRPQDLHRVGGKYDFVVQTWDSLSQSWNQLANISSFIAGGREACCFSLGGTKKW